MGAEIGATTSMFPFNKRQYDFLVATNRKPIADLSQAFRSGGRARGWVGECAEAGTRSIAGRAIAGQGLHPGLILVNKKN